MSSSASRMPIVSLDDRAAVADSIYAFYHLVDSGQASRTAQLFTEDAELTFGPGSPQPGTTVGAAIGDAMRAREAVKSAFTRHIVSSIRFAAAGDDVRADYILTLYRSDDETRSSIPAFVADVAEVWRQTGGEWRMAMRTILPAFTRA
jgi:ketosteroid isomerase-like protein